MILRSVVVAPERERLRGPRAVGLMGPAPAVDQLAAASPVAVPEPDPRVAPRLTLEAVCEWLQAQPPEVRSACARQLAPDLEMLAQSARERGQEEGRARGRQETLEGVRSGLTTLAQVVAASEQAFTRECAQLAEGCAQIVAEVFRKLAGTALASQEATLGVVREVLKRAKDERALSIRVSAQDLPFLESQRTAIQEALGTRAFTLCVDARVSLGGCLVESSLGTLDGRLEIQLQELAATLRAAKAAGGASA